MSESVWDAVVIGAGQAGGPLAGALAKAGWKVALLEREHVGGTCVNEGCTPTKTMIASARVAHVARRAGEYGVQSGPVSVDLRRVRDRKRQVVESFRSGSRASLERIPGVELIFGEAKFTGVKRLEVRLQGGGTRSLESDKIFINAGTRPFMPDIPGLSEVGALDSTAIMELDSVPEHLVILGGGYIGFEFAQMFARFGSRVTLIERAKRLLEREDEDVSTEIVRVLKAEGVNFESGCEVKRVQLTSSGQIELELDSVSDRHGVADRHGETGQRSITGSHLLVAIGRTSNADGLNLEATGLKTDEKGYIAVQPTLETDVAGIYALGDIKGGPAFTHISYDDYRIVRDALLHGATRTMAERPVPYTMFTDPQLARVGMSEDQARQSGKSLRLYRLPMTSAARAIEMFETAGMMKAVVDAQTDLILGATVLGYEGGEVMAVLQMAMIGGVKSAAIRDGVFAHPTMSESLNNLFSSTPVTI